MIVLVSLLLIISLAGCIYLGTMWFLARTAANRSVDEAEALSSKLEKLRTQNTRLSKWANVVDADEKARELLIGAYNSVEQAKTDARILTANAEQHYKNLLEQAQSEASETTTEARAKAKQLTADAHAAMTSAAARSAEILAEANQKAEEIAGKAYDAVRNADLYERTAKAMKNIIEGYGDEYLMPAESLLDGLAEEYSHKQAGQELKLARAQTKVLIKAGVASRCNYVEANRREGAERFVLDAFNGKVDSILSRVKHDNVGKLEREIKDAFTQVNYGGRAFREAKITEEYCVARLQELKWAVVTQELRLQEREEQRLIKEQIREEEKARREFEKAIREAAKEEDMLKKAMAAAEAKVSSANEEQRAILEAQLAELGGKLLEAEERNQRAISMAQQTRRGHVYVISNVGSFGEDVYKIGLTRRLEPLDRVKELGDASVPFSFDVHAMIFSEDAPAFESRLHKHFVEKQINKVNHRKEFFRATLGEIRRMIEASGVEAKWTMAAEAREFRETLAIQRAIEAKSTAMDARENPQLTLDPTDSIEPIVGSED